MKTTLALAYKHKIWIIFGVIVVAVAGGLLGWSSASPKVNLSSEQAYTNDLRAYANQKGLSYDEVANLYGWHHDFKPVARAASEHESYVHTEYVDGGVVLAFAGGVPPTVQHMIDDFAAANPAITVIARTNLQFNERQLSRATYLVNRTIGANSEVLASWRTHGNKGNIRALVQLAPGIESARFLPELQTIAEEALQAYEHSAGMTVTVEEYKGTGTLNTVTNAG